MGTRSWAQRIRKGWVAGIRVVFIPGTRQLGERWGLEEQPKWGLKFSLIRLIQGLLKASC